MIPSCFKWSRLKHHKRKRATACPNPRRSLQDPSVLLFGFLKRIPVLSVSLSPPAAHQLRANFNKSILSQCISDRKRKTMRRSRTRMCTNPPCKVKWDSLSKLKRRAQGQEDSAVSSVARRHAFIFHRHSFSQTFKRDCRGSSVSRQSNTAPVWSFEKEVWPVVQVCQCANWK